MRLLLLILILLVLPIAGLPGQNFVFVTRFWHNHQPIYWPEWNSAGSEGQRVQLAFDSIQLKGAQNYGGLSARLHPENDLPAIFGLDDRRNAYQGGPAASLQTFASGGFAMSYSGSLIANVRQLGQFGQLGYNSAWNVPNTTARRDWKRLDLVGFTYHHSLGPLLPKGVFRQEIRLFKEAWREAWGGSADLSDHSRGFFPTEMAFTREMIDVLVDEGYDWVIVASHHLSRTSPGYLSKADPEGSFGIYSSPPNRADLLGPEAEDPSQWWFGEPNPGNAAWNLAPFAYQLHRLRYVNPESGESKEIIGVPSDDVLSYRFGYAAEGLESIQAQIAPYANDPLRPVIVMPSTDGDNAWGGGSSSWMENTPRFFNSALSAGFTPTMPGTFVEQFGAHAELAHIEDGAWIFPESDYGSPYFLKWIEPPLVNRNAETTQVYPGTIVDLETPGFSLKFFSYAPLMAGANWVLTAEQILLEEGGTLRPAAMHAPYGADGQSFADRHPVELAWHIYLKGLDSGFNYYGGLGNDDEVKPALATKRAVDTLRPFLETRLHKDRTGPTVLRPQRFPWNPGDYTFGWFNNTPEAPGFLKKMPTTFYIWTHAYDLSGIASVNLRIRRDKDGKRSLNNTENETYAGGPGLEPWQTIAMFRRSLPNTRETLNQAAANPGQIDYFVFDPAFPPQTGIELADYYFARLDEDNFPDLPNSLFDYYIEATDLRGNTTRSDIQHVWVGDGKGSSGEEEPPPPPVRAGLSVLSPERSLVVSQDTAYFTFEGIAGDDLESVIYWENKSSGTSGSFLRSPRWSQSIPLQEGPNRVVISALRSADAYETKAEDSPANPPYAGGWTSDQAAGTGWGSWNLQASTNSGHFIARANLHGNLSLPEEVGFGLWANNGGRSEAWRALTASAQAGDTLLIRMDNNSIEDGGEVGFALESALGALLLRFYFVGGELNYRLEDADGSRVSPIPFTSNGLDLHVSFKENHAYDLRVGAHLISGFFAEQSDFARIRLFNQSAGPDEPHNFYLGSLRLTRPVDSPAPLTMEVPLVVRAGATVTDGLPNDWWDSIPMGLAERLARGDPDNDGFDNFREFLLGTDPLDPASSLRFSLSTEDEGSFSFEWSTIPGQRFLLQGSVNLDSASWTPLSPVLTAQGSTLSFNFKPGELPQLRFFRVILQTDD